MKNRIKVLLVIIILSLGLIGCSDNSKEIPNKNIENISEVNMSELMKYKGSYPADNNAVRNILSNLPGNMYCSDFSLKIDEEPYEISVNYESNEELSIEDYNKFWSDKEPNEFLENNAIVLFSLIPNVHIVRFNVDNIEEELYKYERKKLQMKYDKGLTSLSKDETSLKDFFENK